MKKMIFAALLAVMAGTAWAAEAETDIMTPAERCEAKYGQQAGESNTAYEERIEDAKRTLKAARGYIDSNMLWYDENDYFLNN